MYAGYNTVMVRLNAHFDGKVIVPDERTTLTAGTRLRVTVEPVDLPAMPLFNNIELPLLTGVDPKLARAIMEGHEYDIENAKMDRFVTPPRA